MTAEFRGWPREALDFLRELEAHNEREWFHTHRAEYETLVAEPARALGRDLADLGRPKVFRPFNDTRFHAGPPIKEHIGLAVGYEGAGGWYVELSLDGLLLAAGLHNPQRDQLERLRAAAADGRRGGTLRRAVRAGETAGLALNEPDMKRLPRGYPADHPRADLLMRRRLVLTRRDPVAAWMASPAAGPRIRAALEAGGPLVRWLRANVGPSGR